MKDRVGNEVNEGDFVVYVTAGDRHPVLEFGWVLGFHESKSSYGSYNQTKIKIQRATPKGKRQTVEAVDVPAHWREDTPDHIKDYNSGYRRTQEEYDQYYVNPTYRDTGRPSTTMLSVHEGNNNRFLVTQPV